MDTKFTFLITSRVLSFFIFCCAIKRFWGDSRIFEEIYLYVLNENFLGNLSEFALAFSSFLSFILRGDRFGKSGRWRWSSPLTRKISCIKQPWNTNTHLPWILPTRRRRWMCVIPTHIGNVLQWKRVEKWKSLLKFPPKPFFSRLWRQRNVCICFLLRLNGLSRRKRKIPWKAILEKEFSSSFVNGI
jgi:hypothetical protein